jgi:hypothetical protein
MMIKLYRQLGGRGGYLLKKLYVSMLVNNIIGINVIIFLLVFNSLSPIFIGSILLLFLVSVLIQSIYLIRYDEDKKVFHTISLGIIVFLKTTLYIAFPREYSIEINLSYLLFLLYLFVLLIHLFIVQLHEDSFS